MARKLNQPKDFWHELKRRKVFNVVTVYAGTAFVIIQLVAAVKDPLHLPGWFPTMVIVLLCIGFLLAVFFSWVYEITPSGMKVTKPERTGRRSDPAAATHSAFTLTSTETSKGWKIATYASLVVIAALAGWHFYPKVFPQDPIKRLQSAGGKLTVAVMPFRNMSNDTGLNYLQNGIQDNLTVDLNNYSDELVVRQTETVRSILESRHISNNASVLPDVAGEVSRRINAEVYIAGSLQKEGSTLRINSLIVDSKTNETMKSFKIEDKNGEGQVMILMDSLSALVKNFLIMSKLSDNPIIISGKKYLTTTNSLGAFKNHIYGLEAIRKIDYKLAQKYFLNALKNDSNYFLPKRLLTTTYGDSGNWDSAKFWCRKIYDQRVNLSEIFRLEACGTYARFYETPVQEIEYFSEIYELDEQNLNSLYRIGLAYNKLHKYNQSIPYFEKCLKMYLKWSIKPWWVYNYTVLGYSYHKTGQYKKEAMLYKKAEKDFPDDPAILYWQAILALSLKKTGEANNYLEKYQSVQRQNLVSDASIAASLANIYLEAGIYEKAEEYFRKVVALEPDRPGRKNTLANFLIKYDRNVNEGIDIAVNLLAAYPDNYSSLRAQGLGFYKQGKHKEALEILEKSWKLRREKAVYDHEAWMQLEEARKAVGSL